MNTIAWTFSGLGRFGCIACVAVTLLALLPRSFGSERPVFGVFYGTSPCTEPIRELLRIPTNGEPEVIEWKLTLHQAATYELRCEYGLTAAGKPGLAKNATALERKGTWTTTKGIRSNPEAVVYELNGALSLVQVDSNILHVLNSDRSLMVGNGGWSYTLNRSSHSEKAVDAASAASQPDMSYQISPLASGPTVFGVFEGRSPCQGIAGQLKIPVHGGCNKAKWRVTLYHDPQALAPTTYRLEGTLFRRNPREGTWTIMRGRVGDPAAAVYELAATKTKPALFLLKGDNNVLFFLDHDRNFLVGHRDFSYTLNRREQNGP